MTLPSPPYDGDELATLTGFLDYQRAVLRRKVEGLDADQLRATCPPSDLTLGGMVKHLAFVEDWWFGRMMLGEQSEPWAAVDWQADPDWDWHSAADDSAEQLWATYDDAVRRSDAVAAAGDLDRLSVRETRSGDRVNLRWVLVHMVEEYARHLGHADLIRQSIDGSVGD